MSSPPGLPGQVIENAPEEKMDKSLQKENKRLRGDIKQMEMKIKAMQVELSKSYQMKDRLEGLCRELQKQNKFIKAESSAKIQEANARGKELASEVQNNMGFMKSINDNLQAISAESLLVKKENEDLAKKIAVLKGHYEEREQILQAALKETNTSLQTAKAELAETKVKSSEEKERLIGEMQKLADALLQSREQIKENKEIELGLREMIQGYEDKFNGLQKALKDTNGSYEEFRNEMTKVTSRTKELEKETVKWQKRWEESNTALTKMKENYIRVTNEFDKSKENLERLKGLCRSLHNENRQLLQELKGNMQTEVSATSGADMSLEVDQLCAAKSEESTPSEKNCSNDCGKEVSKLETNDKSTDGPVSTPANCEIPSSPEKSLNAPESDSTNENNATPLQIASQNDSIPECKTAEKQPVSEEPQTSSPTEDAKQQVPPSVPNDLKLEQDVSQSNEAVVEEKEQQTPQKVASSNESNKSDGECSSKGKKNKKKKHKK